MSPTKQLYCFECRECVSTPVDTATMIRGTITCPECEEKQKKNLGRVAVVIQTTKNGTPIVWGACPITSPAALDKLAQVVDNAPANLTLVVTTFSNTADLMADLDAANDADACACDGCGCHPGDGLTEGCEDQNGCGYFKRMNSQTQG